MKCKIYMIASIGLSCLIFSSCMNDTRVTMSYQLPEVYEKKEINYKSNDIYHKVRNVKIAAVGDLMFHKYQLTRSYDKNLDEFNFDDTFYYVNHYLQDADFTVGNLETTLAGKNGSRKINVSDFVKGYSGYPCFNTPDSVASTLKKSGFDLVTTANNHCLDSYESGLKRTLDVLDDYEILHVGTYRNLTEANKINIVKINDINFAFLGFTYGMNGFSLSDDEPYLVDHLNMYSEDKITEMIKKVNKAYSKKPDFIIVMIHFGNEYKEFPNQYQKDIVDRLFEAGADVILGSHPHVIQPMEIRKIERENGEIDTGVVIYSLGNFISSQRYEKNINKDLGVILNIEFQKIDNEEIIKSVSFIPTYSYWTKEVIGVLPVDEALYRINSEELILSNYDIKRLNYAKDYVPKHIMSNIKDYNYYYEDYKYIVRIE